MDYFRYFYLSTIFAALGDLILQYTSSINDNLPRLVLMSKNSKSDFRPVHHMDENLPEDIENVLQISALLEIREFDFFHLAYQWWFDQSPNDRILERYFVRYMFNQIVPYWVRNYCRMLLELHSQGKLNRDQLGIAKLPDATTQSVRTGLRYFVALLITMGMLLLTAELAVQFRVLPCMFPPCY